MKKQIITLAIGLIALTGLFAQHFVPAWHVTPPPNGQNPYNAMNFYIHAAQVFGVDLEAGDEIGIFDGDTCVGAVALTQPIADYQYELVDIKVSMGGGVPGSAADGNFIIFKIWKASTSTEYSYPEMSVFFTNPLIYEFLQLGTCEVTMLSYQTPTAVVSESVTPPTGPGGGYVYDIPGAGLTLDQIWINADGGGEIRSYSFNTPSTDIHFDGAPPINYSPYGWVIDASDISYNATTEFPAIVSFDIAGLPGVLDPSTVTLYQRDIHGTGAYTQITAYWDGEYLVAEVTSFGDFILGGGTDNPLPVELSSFNAVMTAEHYVNLTWVSETETLMQGYNVLRSETNLPADGIFVNANIIPATNTSTTQTYNFIDEDVEVSHTYFYWLESVDLNGMSNLHGPVSVTITSGEVPDIPEIVLNNDVFIYPNPMGRTGKIKVHVKEGDAGTVTIYNSKGQLVKSINAEPGSHTYTWDGDGCASGIYFYKLITNKDKLTKKLIIMK